jgi:hypothetical protein
MLPSNTEMWVKFRKQLRTSPRITFVKNRMAGDFGQKLIRRCEEERDRDAKTRTSSRSKGFFLATKPSRD